MTEYTMYVAFDGEEFYDECDCLAYERKMQATNFEGEIFFYGADRKPIPLDIADLDDVYFVNIKTEKACRWSIDRCEDCVLTHPWSNSSNRKNVLPMTGFFWFNIDNNTWHRWQTENENLNEIQDYFQLKED